MKIHKLQAKPISYDSKKRSRRTIYYIPIHGTGNKGDTAKNNAKYFAETNTRAAGAHFFVDQKGEIWQSIPMNRIAHAVGGSKYSDCSKTGGGTYYGKCANFNSVSIELCDIIDKEPSEAMIKSVKWLIKYIQKYCPNAKTIIRHFDVNGKNCPSSMAGKDNKVWECFKLNCQTPYKVETTVSGVKLRKTLGGKIVKRYAKGKKLTVAAVYLKDGKFYAKGKLSKKYFCLTNTKKI